jgi:hypothetical protein
MLEALILLIMFFCVAFVFNEGLWSAAVLLINVLLAGIIAVNFFEPLANWFDSMMPSLTYFWDFLSVWICFSLALVALRLTTGFLSRHRVRFKRPVDVGGGVFFAVCVGWVMMQFTLFTFHLAPLGRNFLGFQQQPDTRMIFGLAPDRTWLALMNDLSTGSLSRPAPDPAANPHAFNPQDDFILKYGQRRKQYEKQGLTVSK